MNGIGASQGIAIGKAYIKSSQIKLEKHAIDNAEEELKKLYYHIEKSKEQLRDIVITTEANIGAKEAQIFQAHIMILEDAELVNRQL